MQRDSASVFSFTTHRKLEGYRTRPLAQDSPEPSSELPRPVEKLPVEDEEEEKEEEVEEVAVGGSVEEKVGWGMEDGLG